MAAADVPHGERPMVHARRILRMGDPDARPLHEAVLRFLGLWELPAAACDSRALLERQAKRPRARALRDVRRARRPHAPDGARHLRRVHLSLEANPVEALMTRTRS